MLRQIFMYTNFQAPGTCAPRQIAFSHVFKTWGTGFFFEGLFRCALIEKTWDPQKIQVWRFFGAPYGCIWMVRFSSHDELKRRQNPMLAWVEADGYWDGTIPIRGEFAEMDTFPTMEIKSIFASFEANPDKDMRLMDLSGAQFHFQLRGNWKSLAGKYGLPV